MHLGRALIFFGAALVVVGALIEFVPWLRLGRLPGDVSFGGSNWRVYAPIGTSILISIVLTLLFSAISLLRSR